MRYLDVIFYPLLILLLCSCDGFLERLIKDDNESLHPMTSTGENTVGYLLNGEMVNSESSLDVTAVYQRGVLSFGGGKRKASAKPRVEANLFAIDPVIENVKYNLMEYPKYSARFTRISDMNCNYDYENTFSGSLEFKNIDRDNYIISGVFEFSTVVAECDTVHITDGRFDLKYIP